MPVPIKLYSVSQLKKETKDDRLVKSLHSVYASPVIYKRFDALCNLISECDRVFLDDKKDIGVEKLSELKNTATRIAMAIVDARDNKSFEEKIKHRDEYKKLDPAYMPWHTPITRTSLDMKAPRDAVLQTLHNFAKKNSSKKYNPEKLDLKDKKQAANKISAQRIQYLKQATQKIMLNALEKRLIIVNQSDAKFDEEHNVQYQTDEAKREVNRIFAHNEALKKLCIINNDDAQELILENFDTDNYVAHPDAHKAIFVLSPKGDLYAGSSERHTFYHSSFLAGQAVIFAGVMMVSEGKLVHFDDYSGHYSPDFRHNLQMLAFFRKCGLLTPGMSYQAYDEQEQRFFVKPIYASSYNVNEPRKKLLEACGTYRNYLQTIIVKSNVTDEEFKLIKLKLDVINQLSAALDDQQNKKPVQEQLYDFKELYKKHAAIIKMRRDSNGMIFMKVVSTIFTLGIAAAFGIWAVKGRAAAKQIEAGYVKLAKKK